MLYEIRLVQLRKSYANTMKSKVDVGFAAIFEWVPDFI